MISPEARLPRLVSSPLIVNLQTILVMNGQCHVTATPKQAVMEKLNAAIST